MQLITLYHHCLPLSVEMSWNIGENANIILKMNSKMGQTTKMMLYYRH